MIEADRADHSRAKLDHDLIVPITNPDRPDRNGQTPVETSETALLIHI